MKSRLVLSLGLSIGAVGVEPGMIRTANETGEIALVCGHDALAVGLSGLGWVTSDLPVQVLSLVGLAFLLFLVRVVVFTRVSMPVLWLIASSKDMGNHQN